MGTCSSVALEDEINNNASDNIYNLLVYGYSRQLRGVDIPDSVMNIIDTYVPRARWGGIYGQNGGRAFDSLHLNGFTNKITGVEIYGGRFVDSIRFQVNGKWTKKHGGSGGGKQTLILKENEDFNRVEIRSGAWIDRLVLHTTLGRSIIAGGNGGGYHQEGDGNSVLIDCKGRSGAFVDQIQFLWQ